MKVKNLKHARNIFQNNGFDTTDRDDLGRCSRVGLEEFLKDGMNDFHHKRDAGLTFRDALVTSDIAPWMPQIIQDTVLDAQEPRLVLTSLFDKVQYQAGQIIEFPAMGAMVAFDVAEGQEVPEASINYGGATTTAKVGKVGVKFRLTEEVMRHSRFDVLRMHLIKAGQALARLKEQKAANFLNALGVPCFDNINPTNSVKGVTTGRGLNGSANGSLTLDDLFDTFAQVMVQGFTPDTLIMNPLTFVMFIKDMELRSIALAAGNQMWFGGFTGSAGKVSGSRSHTSGGNKVILGTPASSDSSSVQADFNQTMDTAPVLPSRWPWPFKIVVSPFVPFDPSTMLTNIIVADSMELGLYIEDYPVRVSQWDDMNTDVRSVKLMESYCFHVAQEGLAVGVLKNVKVTPNMVVFPAQPTLSVTGAIDTISPTTPISF